ncbi:unnamed protein product [Absidia cylindrospora]
MTDDDLIQRIWKLSNDLATQQQTNHDSASGIKTQINQLQTQNTSNDSHNQDFEMDGEDLLPELLPGNSIDTNNAEILKSISSKHSKLLQEHSQSKARNQELEQECAELQDLVKQYESSLELIAGKLRTHSHISSERELQLRREYEALLDAEKDTTTSLFMENTFLQSQLVKLSEMLRNTYEQDTTMVVVDTQLHQLMTENQGLRAMLKISEQQPNSPSTSASPSVCRQKPSSTSLSSPAFAFLSKQSTTPALQVEKSSSRVIQDYFGDRSDSNSS